MATQWCMAAAPSWNAKSNNDQRHDNQRDDQLDDEREEDEVDGDGDDEEDQETARATETQRIALVAPRGLGQPLAGLRCTRRVSCSRS